MMAMTRLEYVRSKVMERSRACQDEAERIRATTGETRTWQTLREEAEWLDALVLFIDGEDDEKPRNRHAVR